MVKTPMRICQAFPSVSIWRSQTVEKLILWSRGRAAWCVISCKDLTTCSLFFLLENGSFYMILLSYFMLTSNTNLCQVLQLTWVKGGIPCKFLVVSHGIQGQEGSWEPARWGTGVSSLSLIYLLPLASLYAPMLLSSLLLSKLPVVFILERPTWLFLT